MPDPVDVGSTAALPKVDLHRHLEGSLRLSTLEELARTGKIDLPLETGKLKSLIGIDFSRPS